MTNIPIAEKLLNVTLSNGCTRHNLIGLFKYFDVRMLESDWFLNLDARWTISECFCRSKSRVHVCKGLRTPTLKCVSAPRWEKRCACIVLPNVILTQNIYVRSYEQLLNVRKFTNCWEQTPEKPNKNEFDRKYYTWFEFDDGKSFRTERRKLSVFGVLIKFYSYSWETLILR